MLASIKKFIELMNGYVSTMMWHFLVIVKKMKEEEEEMSGIYGSKMGERRE